MNDFWKSVTFLAKVSGYALIGYKETLRRVIANEYLGKKTSSLTAIQRLQLQWLEAEQNLEAVGVDETKAKAIIEKQEADKQIAIAGEVKKIITIGERKLLSKPKAKSWLQKIIH